MSIRNFLIRKLGGVTLEKHYTDLSKTAASNYKYGKEEGYAKAKARATGLLDGFYGKDSIGRPIDLSKLVRERV